MTESLARSWIGSSPSQRPRKPWPMSKRDAQKARSSYHSSENAASQVNTGTFTATGEQYEYIAESDRQLDERANASDHRSRSGVRLSRARGEQSRHAGRV